MQFLKFMNNGGSKRQTCERYVSPQLLSKIVARSDNSKPLDTTS